MSKQKTCIVCGKSFQLPMYWKHDRSTCSEKCRYALTGSKMSKRESRVCPICNASFSVAPSSKKICCSLSCRTIFMRKKFEGENNPNWKKVKQVRPASKRSLRNHIKKRDKVCQDCGDSKEVQVHHIDSDPKNNSDKNLVLLCKTCHANRHKHMGESHLIGLILANRTYSNTPSRNCAICGASFNPKHKNTICCSPKCGRIKSGLSRRG